jgi:hypothetical protein
MGMPFRNPRIGILGSAHYGSGQVQGLDNIDLETKKEGTNPYSTRILVNSCPVAYIKSGKGAPREHNLIDIEYHRQAILDIQDRLDID